MDSEKQRQSGVVARSGQCVELVMYSRSAEIHSDFTQTGQVDFSADERTARARRPGSILLPVLNLNTVRHDLSINDGDNYLTPVYLRPSGPHSLQAGDDLLLTVRDADQHRMAGYRQLEDTWSGALGGGTICESWISVPDGWSGEHFRMCALTLAGDPATPAPPASEPPPESSHETTLPGEVWLELYHRRENQLEKADAALCLIAPLLLQSNLEPPRSLYVVSKTNTHSFVYDVMEACWAAVGPDEPFDRDFALEFPASTPNATDEGPTVEPGQCLLGADTMYLINGEEYGDSWIQDQMTTGYCSAPGGRAFNVAVNCKRQGHLYDFVDDDLKEAVDNGFVFNGLFGGDQNTHDYGGNIAVSPPVPEATAKEDTSWAGPSVPKHPPAPHGKIVLGDCYNPRRIETDPGAGNGLIHDDTRTFLQSQGMQPIIPIDTSWLQVGHVDEIMGFVPAPDDPRPAKLAMARPDVMNTLLARTRQWSVQQGRTHFHRGRYKRHFVSLNFFQDYDETSVEALYDEGVIDTNDRVHRELLGPIEHRLRHCTGLDREDDVLPLPVCFTYVDDNTNRPWGTSLAETRTPNLVNMQVLKQSPEETHLLVPRPCGPRLPPGDAETVVEEILADIKRDDITVRRPQDDPTRSGFHFWAWPGLSIEKLALFFARERPDGTLLTEDDRAEMINRIEQNMSYQTLPNNLPGAVHHTLDAIHDANPGAQPFLSPDNDNFENWYRLFIPEDTVDVLELYTKSVLASIGCTVHFVDSWYHHTRRGGVHCGTNVLHKPSTDRSWWDDYPDLAAYNVDTTYNPHNTVHTP